LKGRGKEGGTTASCTLTHLKEKKIKTGKIVRREESGRNCILSLRRGSASHQALGEIKWTAYSDNHGGTGKGKKPSSHFVSKKAITDNIKSGGRGRNRFGP